MYVIGWFIPGLLSKFPFWAFRYDSVIQYRSPLLGSQIRDLPSAISLRRCAFTPPNVSIGPIECYSGACAQVASRLAAL
jgi:hypothetical protein